MDAQLRDDIADFILLSSVCDCWNQKWNGVKFQGKDKNGSYEKEKLKKNRQPETINQWVSYVLSQAVSRQIQVLQGKSQPGVWGEKMDFQRWP